MPHDQAAAQAPLSAPPDAFAFGRNWQRFVAEHLSPEREEIARRSVRELVGEGLQGRSFLDIGAGSGLFSLAALRLGAERIVSLDVDPDSVESCRRLRRAAGEPKTWSVVQGSILDERVVEALEPADVVYSWGVLHHTGDMWSAIRNAASLVAPGGRFCIAIYNDAHARRVFTSARWRAIKRAYNRAPRPLQRAMELGYEGFHAARLLAKGRNPRAEAREYKRTRGMALSTDLVDWLGGYPYEYASAAEIVSFCESQCGLRLLHKTELDARDVGNNEFAFERPAAA